MQTARGASLSDADTQSPAGSRRRLLLIGVVALGVWLLDQVTKIVAVQQLEGREPVSVVGDLLTLRLVYNSGAAFGMASGMTVALTVVAVVVSVVIVRLASRISNLWWVLALALMLGGAIGNLTDRMVRDPGPFRGHVVDFLALPDFPVFNVADMSVVGGASLMVLLSLLNVPFESAGDVAELATDAPETQQAPAADDGADEVAVHEPGTTSPTTSPTTERPGDDERR